MKDTWAKNKLRTKGWSLRKAAKVLNIHFIYLWQITNGVHTSIRLNGRIAELPDYSDFLRANPNFFVNRRHVPRSTNRRAK